MRVRASSSTLNHSVGVNGTSDFFQKNGEFRTLLSLCWAPVVGLPRLGKARRLKRVTDRGALELASVGFRARR